MTKTRFPRREHPAVLQRRNRAYMAAFVPEEQRERYEKDFPESRLAPLPKRRGPIGQHGRPLERDVLAATLSALQSDDRVWHVERTQSAVLGTTGNMIRFGFKGKLDITGMLKGGRYFEIEAKRPGEEPDERQAKRIEHILLGGGISGWFDSVEGATRILFP